MMHQHSTLNCKGKLLDLSTPVVMGVLNITPDSFFDGGKYDSEFRILKQAEKMINEGAMILDIGGMSSRPGAQIIDYQEELQRVLPAIEVIIKSFPDTILSIDTLSSKVAKEAVAYGASIVNDISAGSLDGEMFGAVAALGVPYILMHMKGKPQDMQEKPSYEDVVLEVLDFFIAKIEILKKLGINDIIIDPGFGFGKEIDDNFRLLKSLTAFNILGYPILAGVSRKSFIYKTLNISAKEALTGTIALNMVALEQGAKILRVHDVKEAQETIKIWQSLNGV
jgi:dihydropteroate synthase